MTTYEDLVENAKKRRRITMDGHVKRKIEDKGFGFIRSSEDLLEYFFHRSACLADGFDDLEIGDKVSFEPVESEKGPRARNVVRI